jgi:hypothetical protein
VVTEVIISQSVNDTPLQQKMILSVALGRMWQHVVLEFSGVLLSICLGSEESYIKHWNNWSSGQDLNLGPSEYKTGVLTMRNVFNDDISTYMEHNLFWDIMSFW